MRETAAYGTTVSQLIVTLPVNERKREEDDKAKVMELQKEFRGIFSQVRKIKEIS
jgi:hypothetical protein